MEKSKIVWTKTDRTEEYQEEKRISLGQYNKEIDESIAQIEKGEIYTHQEVGERISKWSKR